jgi:hypothetical protein
LCYYIKPFLVVGIRSTSVLVGYNYDLIYSVVFDDMARC